MESTDPGIIVNAYTVTKRKIKSLPLLGQPIGLRAINQLSKDFIAVLNICWCYNMYFYTCMATSYSVHGYIAINN